MSEFEKIREYVNNRLGSGRDDRCNESKLMDDAELRGSLGEREANRVIESIDDIKSRLMLR